MLTNSASIPDILVTVPVYNEQNRLAQTVESLWVSLERAGLPYRLSISEDGSTDGTPSLVRRLGAKYPQLLISQDEERRGRGYALRHLWEQVPAEIYAFTDADLPAGPDALNQVIQAVRDGADVATASRYCPGAQVTRPPLRSFFSQRYNWFVRTKFRDGIYDHQCGIKAFSRRAVELIVGESREDSWFWDTEVMVLAQRRGLRVVEIPVAWKENKHSRTSTKRLLSDLRLHGAGLLRLIAREDAHYSPRGIVGATAESS
jgi:glycosyltransferase AglD